MLSITPVGMTDFNALLHFPSLGNGWEIVGTAGGVVELVNVAEVGRLQPVPSLTTSASIAANGTFMYPINQTAGRPLFPRLLMGQPAEPWFLSAALNSATHSASSFTTLADGLSSKTLYANFASVALGPNSGSTTPSFPFLPISMTDVNGTLFIQGEENGAEELWRSDGTSDGTILLNSFVPTFDFEMLDRGAHAVVNGTFFFFSDDGHGLQLWKSDGTPSGTVMVKDINPAGEGWYPSVMTDVNGTLFFSAFDGVSNSLWKSNGTADGTMELTPVPVVGAIAAVNGDALFSVDDASGWSLWKSDGTAAGTGKVALVNPYFNSVGFDLLSMNGSVYFAPDWNSGLSSPFYHTSLWTSDGTAAGTTMLSGLHSNMGFSYAYLGTEANGALYFPVYSGDGGFFDNYATPPHGIYELWKSDGTAAGTAPIKAFDSWIPTSLTDVNGKLFFTADNGTLGSGLWTSDGTADGTVVVKDFGAQMAGSPIDLTNVNGALYFTLSNGTQGLEIWKSDGTSAGTVQVARLDLSSPDMNPWTHFANVNGTLFFTDLDQQGNTELWRTDGTSSGTVLVKVFGDPSPSPTLTPPAPTGGSPSPSIDPTTSPASAQADFVQAAQLLNSGGTATANNSSLTVSSGQTRPGATTTAIRIAATPNSDSQKTAGTTGSLTVRATQDSPGTTQSLFALPDGESAFEVDDPTSAFRF
jgi:ELWxxDGT repeat protein